MEPSAPPEGGSAPTTPRHSIPSVPAPAAYAPLDAAAAEPPVIESPHRTRSRSTFKEPGDDPRAQLPPAPTHEHAQPEPKPAAMDVDEQLEAPYGPPTPTATSPSHSHLPSFLSDDPLSDDPNSSSDDDSDGNAKPPRAPRFDSHGLRRPTPSYYYDADYDPANVGAKKRRRRGGMKGIPVFEPTMSEFEGEGGFYGYVKRIEKYGMRSGVVKVVPPKEWSDALPSTSAPLKAIRMREPIEQHMVGSQGLYRVTNVAKSRIWNPAQWKAASETSKWSPPDFLEDKPDRTERSTKGVSTRKVPVEGATPRVRKPPAEPTGERKKKGKRGRKKGPVKGKGKAVETVVEDEHAEDEHADGEADGDVEMEHDDAETKPIDVDEHPVDDKEENADATMASMLPSPAATDDLASHLPSPPPQHPDSPPATNATPATTLAPSTLPTTTPTPKKKRPSNMARAEPTEEEWQTFVGTFEKLPHGMKKEDYTIEMLREVERRYWRTLTFGEPPMYGADMKGSLFDDSTKAWNVAHLGDLLPRLAPASCRIPGVVSPYLYFGMWRATFAWHVEDADLYSINYIHFGAPKFWYSVPQEQSDRFERIMEGFFPTDRTKCTQFLRHKSFLASPRVLANSGITLNRVVQLPGEFILTYPKGYHSGFNLGFNAAESINFATERWLPLGKLAKACYCIGDSVNIDVDVWIREAALAESVVKNEALVLLGGIPSPSVSLSGRKRQPPLALRLEDGPTPAKRVKVEQPPPPPFKPRELSKKARIELDKIAKDESWVCALCPDMSTEGLVRVGEPGVKQRKSLAAHRVCVMFTPATWIEVDPASDAEIVRGYAGIEKARWKLKCQLCSEKHGTKVQCTRGKCPKAYHVTCALAEDSGVYLDATTAEDGAAVSLLDQAIKEIDAAKVGSPTTQSKVAIPHRNVPSPVLAPAPAPTPIAGPSTLPVLAPAPPVGGSTAPVEEVDDGGIKLTVLCRLHNPVYQKLETERKAAELKTRVDNELVLQSRIRVRTSGGVFEVTYSACLNHKEAVTVVFDDGKRSDVKWKNIIWPDSPEVAAQKEAAAKRAQDSNAYVWEHRPVAPTKRTSFQPPPVPNGPFMRHAQPYFPHPHPAASHAQPHPQARPSYNHYQYPPPPPGAYGYGYLQPNYSHAGPSQQRQHFAQQYEKQQHAAQLQFPPPPPQNWPSQHYSQHPPPYGWPGPHPRASAPGSAHGYQGRPFPPMETSQQHWQASNSRGDVEATTSPRVASVPEPPPIPVVHA